MPPFDASAGGFSKDANSKKITVFRRENSQTKIIDIDIAKINAGESEDIILQKYDIVDVSQNGKEPRKLPPVINLSEENKINISEMPLKIIE